MGQIEKVRIIFTRLLHLGALIGVLFTLVYALLGEQVVSLFTKDGNVVVLIFSFWLIIHLSQVLNAIAFVYDGLLFGLEEFAYLRKHMIIGGLLVFLPIALWGAQVNSLAIVWSGMILLNLYRGVSGFMRVRSVVNG